MRVPRKRAARASVSRRDAQRVRLALALFACGDTRNHGGTVLEGADA